MRAVVALCALLLGCTYETNYYGVSDAGCGVADMSGYTDHFGEYHEDINLGIFRSESKLQGSATLTLAPAPATIPLPPAVRFPFVREDPPAMALGATLIDLATKDDRPHVVTLSFGKVSQTPLVAFGGGPYSELVAALNLGIGGTTYYAEVDVIEGLQFSVATSRLQAHLVYRITPGGGAVPVPPSTANAGVSASTGVIAHGRQPQRTFTQAGTPALVAGGISNPWIIPPFAKTFRVVALPVNAQMNVDLVTADGGNVVARYPVVAPAVQEYPIPSSAYFVTVQCLAQTPPVTVYSLIFELAL